MSNHTVIINLSALAEPKIDNSIPAIMASYINEDIARQWLSIKAFADLYAKYVSSSPGSCCRLFCVPIYSIGWVLMNMFRKRGSPRPIYWKS